MNEGIVSIADSIGWTDMGTISAEGLKIKPLALDGVLPTPENAMRGVYPLVKNMFLLTNGEPRGTAKDFMDYVLGWEGKKIIMENGYLIPG